MVADGPRDCSPLLTTEDRETGKIQPRNGRSPIRTARARALRRGGNLAEATLWNELKARKLGGHKFVRQFPIGPYFADFACRERKLVVELDGSQHADSKYDRQRDAYMTTNGYSVIRFWSFEAVRDLRSICETILAALDGRLRENIVSADLRYAYAPGKRSNHDAD